VAANGSCRWTRPASSRCGAPPRWPGAAIRKAAWPST
jgi:hypothetical protein